MITFNPPIQFEPNYILGSRQNTTVSSQSNWYIKVLRQRGGYGLTLTCDGLEPMNRSSRCPAENAPKRQEMPYIAIEISM